MDGDLGGLGDDLVILADVRRPEVDENVDDEHDVDEQVDDDDGIAAVGGRLVHAGPGRIVGLVEQESGHVRGEHRGVNHQEQNYPVP